MAFVVELVRGRPDEPGFETSGISTSSWDKLLELAREHGWHPAGCKYDHGFGEPAEVHWGQVTDYNWEDWQYAKRIDSEDARNLAAALHRAIAAGITARTPFLISDSRADPGIVTSARKLADFCERGGFVFAVDD
jgi:hypothetical protein